MSRLIQYWLRGGSWLSHGIVCRSAYRGVNVSPGTRHFTDGFRVVRGGAK